MIETLSKLFLRELEKLKTEITSFKDEEKIWEISGEIKNSSGNLCLHLCGNLQHFIGAVLGNSGYVRNRDAEFTTKDVSREKLIEEIESTIKIIKLTFEKINEAQLNDIYPINVFGYEMTTEYFLTHLTTHLNYHLGQINYHRRILDK